MITYLELVFITTIWCLGMKIITSQNMIFEKIGNFAHQKVEEGKLIYDPLIACEWCMPSIHSLFGYFFAVVLGIITSFSWRLVIIYPLVAIGASVGTGFIWNAYLTMNSYKERNEVQTFYYDNHNKN